MLIHRPIWNPTVHAERASLGFPQLLSISHQHNACKSHAVLIISNLYRPLLYLFLSRPILKNYNLLFSILFRSIFHRSLLRTLFHRSLLRCFIVPYYAVSLFLITLFHCSFLRCFVVPYYAVSMVFQYLRCYRVILRAKFLFVLPIKVKSIRK